MKKIRMKLLGLLTAALILFGGYDLSKKKLETIRAELAESRAREEAE